MLNEVYARNSRYKSCAVVFAKQSILYVDSVPGADISELNFEIGDNFFESYSANIFWFFLILLMNKNTIANYLSINENNNNFVNIANNDFYAPYL